jgi:pyruvate formate lyase activating enzyme
MNGFIHSQESFGTLDGPGIRYVIFLQGCPMRCMYCHNPDTWQIGKGKEVSANEILAEYKKNSSFYKKGGITVSGGEPLLQTDFLIELFKKAKKENIHTCIDTSGITYDPENASYLAKLDELMKYCDLVMLDIKHIDDQKHIRLTGRSNKNILAFAKYLEKKNIPVWIRHIVVEGLTDNPDDLMQLGKFIGSLKNLKALDVLPYHTLGVSKYKELGIPYPLEGVPALPHKVALTAKSCIMDGIRTACETNNPNH